MNKRQKRQVPNWHTAPPPFNPEYRPGFREALSGAYTQWCDEHPESTQEERKKAHSMLAEKLAPSYPKVGHGV